MFFLKRLFGFSLFSWIFEKIVDRNIKSINETVGKIQSIAKGKSILVIDDDRGMKSFVEKWMTGDFTVEQLYRIPDDLNVLKGYDAVVVDGLGIGNGRFKEGFDLCMAYDKPEGQSVVYYSGLGASESDRKELWNRGVACVTKGCNPEKLALAIRFPIMLDKKEEGRNP